MALSKSDTKAVQKAAKQGGLSSSQAKGVVNSANSVGNVPVVPKAVATTTSGSYGIDKKTGLPVGPGNDTPRKGSALTQAAPVDQTVAAPEDSTATSADQSVATGVPKIQGAISTIKDPLSGQEFSRDTSNPASVYQPANKYKQGLAAAQASGLPAPSDAGVARGAVAQYTPQQQDTTAVDNFVSQDPMVNNLFKGITELLNPQNQTSTLMQDYKKLYKQSGLDEINEELIDADTIINGTEDDIRNEIQTAGGFGTDSQVQAMALSRNKGLLKRYNQLVQMKTDATNQLNTLTSLNAQDKQMAQTRLSTQISAMFNLATFQQQAQKNTQEAFNNMVDKVGYAGAYAAYASDPKQLGMIERVMGLQPGGLQQLSQQRDLDRELKIAQIASANRANQPSAPNVQFISATANQPAGTFNPATGQFTPLGGGSSNAGALNQTQSQIQLTDGILKDRYLGAAVGPNAASRLSFSNLFTGGRGNFVAGVEQLRGQLTLQNLQNAKANGATFGALSDSELSLLSSSASKLGTWAIKDGDKVVGYKANESDFRKELDKINSYAKLDYVLKGGAPTDVGLQQYGGHYWVQNSDGSMSQVY